MRLYYMTKLQTALEHILPEKRMKVSRFDQLNDPFELMCGNMASPEDSAKMLAFYEVWCAKVGVMCMGRHWESPVMWAHYAESHSGVCVGFDVDDRLAHDVRYVPDRLPLPFDQLGESFDVSVMHNFFWPLLLTKYDAWRYENEVRVFVELTGNQLEKMQFHRFGPRMRLREIILGAKCKASFEDFAVHIDANIGPVHFTRASPSLNEFKMVPHPDIAPLTFVPSPSVLCKDDNEVAGGA